MCPKCKGKRSLLKKIEGFYIQVSCDECNGSGKSKENALCKTCNDAKTVVKDFGGLNVQVDCPDCNKTVVGE